MKAAVVGKPFTIRFSGSTDFLYVRDCAAAFLACADRSPEGAHRFNLHGESVPLADIVTMIDSHTAPESRGRILVEGVPIPIAPCMDDAAIQQQVGELPRTSLADGVRETMDRFRQLLDEGRLSTHDLED